MLNFIILLIAALLTSINQLWFKDDGHEDEVGISSLSQLFLVEINLIVEINNDIKEI